MRMFRLLRADEIETRVAEVAKDGSWLTLLLYKTARIDASLLDETVGPLFWANDYKTINDNMYCAIGIRNAETGEWIWKWNVGTESNTEAEKGEASDAMKRAGFVWGIGTELYSAPRIFIRRGDADIKEKNNGKGYTCYDKFDVTRIEYDENKRIKALEIVNTKTGRTVFTMDKTTGERRKGSTDSSASVGMTGTDAGAAPGRQTQMDGIQTGTCKMCHKTVPIRELEYGKEKYGHALCRECQKGYAEWKRRQAAGREAEMYAATCEHEDAGDRI
ncbi:MAG: hypothetical protein IJK29_10950 [Bacteroidales bacterium]|nr:hypothetical protein [Bacteroidales bacterium]